MKHCDERGPSFRHDLLVLCALFKECEKIEYYRRRVRVEYLRAGTLFLFVYLFIYLFGAPGGAVG
jgi:hypothetical protein